MLIAWQIVWPLVNPALIGAAPVVRALATILLLLPLGLAMGVPFAAGLTVAGHRDARLVALAWSVNGVFSVVGSVASLTLAVSFGFSTVFIVAIVLYAIATLTARLL